MLAITKSSLLLLATVSSTLAYPDNLDNDVVPAYGYPSEYAPKVLAAVNKLRKRRDLPPLCTNKKLQAAAMRLCYDDVPNADDSTPPFQNLRALSTDDLDKVSKYVTDAGFAWIFPLKALPDSFPLLTGNYTMVGTAYVFVNSSDYKHYWAQVYASGGTEECDSEDSDEVVGTVMPGTEQTEAK